MREQKHIHLDEQTRANLKGMRKERKRLGLSPKDVERLTGISHVTILRYERGMYTPSMARYLLLAEIFGWDIKDTANYRFATARTTRVKNSISRRKQCYGISNSEMSRITSFSRFSITNAVTVNERCTANSFAAVMKVLDDEERRSTLVQELTRKK